MVFVFGVLLVVLFTVGGGSGTPVVHSRCRACCVAVLVVVPCSSYEPSLGCSSLRSIRVFSQHSWGLEAAAWSPPKKSFLPLPSFWLKRLHAWRSVGRPRDGRPAPR